MCVCTSTNNTNDPVLPPNSIQPTFIETKAFASALQSHNSHYTHFWAMLITPQNHSPFRRFYYLDVIVKLTATNRTCIRYWGRRKERKKLVHTHTHTCTHARAPNQEEDMPGSAVPASVTDHNLEVGIRSSSSSYQFHISFFFSQDICWYFSLPGGEIQTSISEGLRFSTLFLRSLLL